jgi:hypothetical protein
VCAVPSTAVFCSSLISYFPGTLLKYFLKDFEMVPVTPVITGVTFVFYIPHALYLFFIIIIIIIIIIIVVVIIIIIIIAIVVINFNFTHQLAWNEIILGCV